MNFFDAHCHIDRVLRGVKVKGVEELGKRWEFLVFVQRGGKDKLGGIVICIFLDSGSSPKSGRVSVGDKWKMSGGKGFMTRDVLPCGRWGWMGMGRGGSRSGWFWSIIGSRYGKANGYTL